MAMMASHWRPQPCQFLSYHMTPMSPQMLLPAIQPRSMLGQPYQLPLPQQTIQVLRQSRSRHLDHKIKVLQLTQRLQQRSQTEVTMSQLMPPQSFDVPNAQRRNLLWVNSSKCYSCPHRYSCLSRHSFDFMLTLCRSAVTSRLTPCLIDATFKAAGSEKLLNGTAIVTRTPMERFDAISVLFPAAHGTLTDPRSVFPDDWTTPRDILSHMPIIKTCQCYERIVKDDCSECSGGGW
jgi:hypothetical protein